MQHEIIQGYRLSPQQKHLWLLHRPDLGANPYRAICVVMITGVLENDPLRRALDEVVRQYEILRTTFRLLQGMSIPVQVIETDGRGAFVTHDLTAFGDVELLARLDQLIVEAKSAEIDYASLPLLHASLVKLTASSHQLFLTAPALCADALSFQHLLRQIAAAYKHPKAEDPSQTETMQYADFAEWQNELLVTQDASVARQFWKQQDLPTLASQRLSFEKRLTREPSFQPATVTVAISAETSARIQAAANVFDVSLSSFGLACWQILLSRLLGRSNTTVGAAVDGRKLGELENAIGLFSKFLPMHSDSLACLPFKNLWKQTSDQELESQRWQDYFQWDDLDSDEKAHFFPFCYEFRKQPTTYRAAGLKFSIYKLDACIDRFRVKFVIEGHEDRFLASLQFDQSLFAIRDVQRLADQLTTLIEDAAMRPDVGIGELELLSASDRQLLLLQFNGTQREYLSAQTVHQLFEEQAAQKSNDIAVVCEAERLTYRDLNARANQLAHYLAKLDVAGDVTVGLCVDRSVDLIVGLLGILKAGGAYVPLDPGLPKARVEMILEEADVRVVVTKSHLKTALPDDLDSVICLDTDAAAIASESLDRPLTVVSSKNLAYVIFTSGSTGRPKGVAVEHRQLVNYVNGIWENLDLSACSSFATVSTIAADLGNTAVFPPLCKGGTLHLIGEERATDADALADYCSRNRIDCLKIVPTHLSALLSGSNPAAVLPRRRLVLGGEACAWSLVEKIRTLSPDCVVLNHYGPTEATVGAITNDVVDDDSALMADTVPLGRPLPNVVAYVLDPCLDPVPVGAPGELHIGGAGLARGYINRADATAEKFIPNPFSSRGERLYKTGDLARYLGDGQIEFLGRCDDQVKIHGYRVEPGEIEVALRNHPVVAESVVLAREDDHGNRRLVAYVVTRDRGSLSVSDLRGFLKGKLPEYMTPSAFVFLDRLPLTLNGKVDRNALSTMEHSRPDGRVFVPPRTRVEETLARIWSDVLGIDIVGVNDNFFDLGGDSILSIQIVARANQAGLGLTPRQLFEHQTVAELAMVAGITAEITAEQGPVTGRVPLTPVQARFFELDQPDLHHYNQAMLLEVHGSADASLFAKAFEQLLLQHDALRFRYERKGDCWEQSIAAPDGVMEIQTVDLSGQPEGEQGRLISDHAATLQASLNLHDGPLMRVALFDRGSQRNSYLLIVIHHLAVDGVSWRILLEDLQTLYRQFGSGERPLLPRKTTSFKSWAERLTEHASSAALRDELDYWCVNGTDHNARLPLDHPGGTNTTASARTVSVSLNADDTRTLLQEVPTAFRTQINEVLLTALVRALARWTGSNSVVVDLEGHGREEILKGVDLSRTVGWFTTIFPVLLDCGDSQTTVDVLRSLKERLRTIPNRGIGYGLLRYSNDAAAEKLRALPQAEVRLNYLGQVDRALLDSSMFTVASQPIGPAQSPNAQRAYLLNIIGSVSAGELRLEWTYSENVHLRETVERLAQNYLHELRELIAQSRSTDEMSYSPSDFPNAKLSQEDLNKVLARLGRAKE